MARRERLAEPLPQEGKRMQPIGDIRLRRRAAHIPVEQGTADGKTRISCAGAKCVAWQPRPCQERREAQFWFDQHISQSLIHQLW